MDMVAIKLFIISCGHWQHIVSPFCVKEQDIQKVMQDFSLYGKFNVGNDYNRKFWCMTPVMSLKKLSN